MNKFFLLLLFTYALTACIDDITSDDCSSEPIEGVFKDGYSLNVVVTLDNMGGTTRAVGPIYQETPEKLKQWEDYIDPEKFRVLFFNHEDKLLFESKSRWVKRFENENRWLVSVPVFTYGNDVYDDDGEWPWEDIRNALTTNKFKIAILANRPEMQWYNGFDRTGLSTEKQWIDNTGPHWTPSDYLLKKVFDLHHCQYDAIYHGKSYRTTSGYEADWGFYDFITEGYNNYEGGNSYINRRPQMGALSSWVEWTFTDKHGFGSQPAILPSQRNPIPMYGIQEFNAISGWQKGTPFNLSKDIPDDHISNGYENNKKSISLLRSVVRLELLIPKTYSKPKAVTLIYSNIYARCEPMDVWTPTDELWNKQHNNNNEGCEISSILNYGPVSRITDSNPSKKKDYQKRMSWFYGAWKEDGKWNFEGTRTADGENTFNINTDFEPIKDNHPYPRIFNTCIQRLTSIVCDDNGDVTDEYGDNYYHYVVYLGERNINDPSDLSKLGDNGSGKPVVMYWAFNIGDKMYGLPITDYSVPNNPAFDINPIEDPNTNDSFKKIADVNDKYMDAITRLTGNDADLLPWPLIRNHVYRLTLSAKDNSNIVYNWNFARDINDNVKSKLNSSSNWTKSNNVWTNASTNVTLGGIFENGDKLSINFTGTTNEITTDHIRLRDQCTMTLSGLNAGQIITIDCQSSSTSAKIVANNATRTQGPNDNMLRTFSPSTTIRIMNRWKVNANGNVTITITGADSQKDFNIYLIKVTKPTTTRSNGGASLNGFGINSEDLHTKSFK